MEVMDQSTGVRENRCCCGPPNLRWRDLFRRPSTGWPDTLTGGQQTIYTHKGRCGLGLLCRAWNLRAGDEVLAPAYNCGTELDPFLYFGLDVKLYSVDGEARIELTDLPGRVTPATRVIYVTHYFGWPQDLAELSLFCKSRGIYLVEDCALSLLSRPRQHPIGVLGDAAIYSFPKTLPVPDGGALCIAGESGSVQRPQKAPRMRTMLRQMLPFCKRTLVSLCDRAGLYDYWPGGLKGRARENGPLTRAGLPEMPPSYYFNGDVLTRRMSGVTRRLLSGLDSAAIVHRRRENYRRLYEAVETSTRLQPLYADLPEGVCPLHLPALTPDPRAVCRRLRERGIAAMPWWGGFHRAFDWTDFPEAMALKRQLLVLPIHEQLHERHLAYMARQIKRLDDEL